jgi:nucleoside-diphosphate-sugar epimerase
MTLTAALSEYSNEILNIGNPEEYKIIDVAEIILKRMGVQSENIEVFDGLNGSATRRSPDITKYNEIFGKYNYTSLEDAVVEFLQCEAKEI